MKRKDRRRYIFMIINLAHTKPTQRMINFMWPHYPFNSGLKLSSPNKGESSLD